MHSHLQFDCCGGDFDADDVTIWSFARWHCWSNAFDWWRKLFFSTRYFSKERRTNEEEKIKFKFELTLKLKGGGQQLAALNHQSNAMLENCVQRPIRVFSSYSLHKDLATLLGS